MRVLPMLQFRSISLHLRAEGLAAFDVRATTQIRTHVAGGVHTVHRFRADLEEERSQACREAGAACAGPGTSASATSSAHAGADAGFGAAGVLPQWAVDYRFPELNLGRYPAPR